MKKICIVSGTRAEYGLLRHLMGLVRDTNDLDLQVIVTGMHLSPEFGMTYREIEADGFKIDCKVEMLLSSDSAVGITKATGLGMIGMADAIARLSPDVIVVLGDRFEILAAVVAGLFARVPVAHIHGGETTEGLIDEGIRHAITKMSYLHFVAAREYKSRVIQLGESPDRVFLVGGLGVDAISRTELLKKTELESVLKVKFGERMLLVTFHPVTLENATSEWQFNELLTALDSLPKNISIIFTKANADTHGRIINSLIDDYAKKNRERTAVFASMGQKLFWSAMALSDAVVGNSSSGLLEAPSFGVPTVNIGDRQRGRLTAQSVVNCQTDSESIRQALRHAMSDEFRNAIAGSRNPYGDGGASERIVNILASLEIGDDTLKKPFYDA